MLPPYSAPPVLAVLDSKLHEVKMAALLLMGLTFVYTAPPCSLAVFSTKPVRSTTRRACKGAPGGQEAQGHAQHGAAGEGMGQLGGGKTTHQPCCIIRARQRCVVAAQAVRCTQSGNAEQARGQIGRGGQLTKVT